MRFGWGRTRKPWSGTVCMWTVCQWRGWGSWTRPPSREWSKRPGMSADSRETNGNWLPSYTPFFSLIHTLNDSQNVAKVHIKETSDFYLQNWYFTNYYYSHNESFNIKAYEFDLWLGWMITYKCLRRRWTLTSADPWTASSLIRRWRMILSLLVSYLNQRRQILWYQRKV